MGKKEIATKSNIKLLNHYITWQNQKDKLQNNHLQLTSVNRKPGNKTISETNHQKTKDTFHIRQNTNKYY